MGGPRMSNSKHRKPKTQPPKTAAIITRRQQRDMFRADMSREMPGVHYCMTRQNGRPSGHMLKRPLQLAARYPYLQINPPWLTLAIVFDIDRGGGALEWETARLPEPLASVASKDTGRAHLIYALASPVLKGENANRKPINLLAAIDGAMTEALNADKGYSGLIAKNPLAGNTWRVLWSRQPAKYELRFLTEFISDEALKRHWPRKQNRNRLSGIGRNVDTFNATRRWAYIAIRDYWPVGDERKRPAFAAWQEAVTNYAAEFNAENWPLYPMTAAETGHIGKSIAKWTWQRFNPATLAAMTAAAKSAAGRRSGIKSGIARRAATADRDAAIVAAATDGMTQRAIAAEFNMTQRGIGKIIARKSDFEN